MRTGLTLAWARTARRSAALVLAAGLLGLLAACASEAGGPVATNDASPEDATPGPPAASASPSEGGSESIRVFAVGDLGNKGDRDDAIAAVIEGYEPDAFLALGDIVYPHASRENFEAFYDSSYGRLAEITWPTPGNHDYRDGGIDAYLEYFAERSPNFPREPYYVFDLGAWRIYSLNSEIGESEPGERMYDWLEQHLIEHPAKCTAAMWHSPVFTAGSKGYDEDGMRPIYDLLVEHDVDLVLTGHDHNYQRWDVGDTAYFVVGTGGKSRYELDLGMDGLAYGNDQVNGALQLDLTADGGRHVFRTMDDELLDPGSFGC